MTWEDLDFWTSGEWNDIQDRLFILAQRNIKVNPKRGDLFKNFDYCPFEKVKVAICGQDPYPNADFATGIAFDIPAERSYYPPTLLTILKEYSEDLGYSFPTSGSLIPWCKQGVLLYNVVPTCYTGYPASHRNWRQWEALSREVVEKLSDQGIVFVFLGSLARHYSQYISWSQNEVICLSHPSPLSANKGHNPFVGSRLFSTINAKLVKLGKDPVNWKLP